MLMECLMLLLPGMISTSIFTLLKKEKTKIYSCIEYYAGFSFMIYFLSSSFMYFRGWTDYSLSLIEFKEQVKYGVVCLLFSVLLPLVIQYWKGRCGLNGKENGSK